jgi:hypothetical protein
VQTGLESGERASMECSIASMLASASAVRLLLFDFFAMDDNGGIIARKTVSSTVDIGDAGKDNEPVLCSDLYCQEQ